MKYFQQMFECKSKLVLTKKQISILLINLLLFLNQIYNDWYYGIEIKNVKKKYYNNGKEFVLFFLICLK